MSNIEDSKWKMARIAKPRLIPENQAGCAVNSRGRGKYGKLVILRRVGAVQ